MQTPLAKSSKVIFIVIGGRTHANAGRVSEEEINGWNTDTSINFVVHQEDVRPWLAKAHVLVVPSHGEGMPKMLLEATACGRPAITNNTFITNPARKVNLPTKAQYSIALANRGLCFRN